MMNIRDHAHKQNIQDTDTDGIIMLVDIEKLVIFKSRPRY